MLFVIYDYRIKVFHKSKFEATFTILIMVSLFVAERVMSVKFLAEIKIISNN